MNKETTQELMMGAVLVMLVYAAYKHFMPAPAKVATKTAQPSGQAGQGVAIGEPAPYTGSPFTMLQDLLSGTTHDIGSFQGKNYLNDISEVKPYNPNDGFKTLVAPWQMP